MVRSIVTALVLLAIPAAAFLGGGTLLNQLSGRKEVPKPGLGLRFHYNASDAEAYWTACEVPSAERTFLELDLIFPCLYGGALAASLLFAWATLGRPFHAGWIVAPVFLTLLTDWTENLIQLGQIERYLAPLRRPLEAGWIQAASLATALKLSFFGASWLALLLLLGRMVYRASKAG